MCKKECPLIAVCYFDVVTGQAETDRINTVCSSILSMAGSGCEIVGNGIFIPLGVVIVLPGIESAMILVRYIFDRFWLAWYIWVT